MDGTKGGKRRREKEIKQVREEGKVTDWSMLVRISLFPFFPLFF
jgi:hypothetical protein